MQYSACVTLTADEVDEVHINLTEMIYYCVSENYLLCTFLKAKSCCRDLVISDVLRFSSTKCGMPCIASLATVFIYLFL